MSSGAGIPLRMAAKYSDEIEKGVESLINCLICTEPYRRPKVLPCQHTFCRSCLQKYHDNYNTQRIIKASNFPCPSCRKTAYLPSNGIDGLPNDFKVDQMKDFFDKINITCQGKGLMCDICRYDNKEKSARSFCVQCGKYLCEGCTIQHNDNSLFKSHIPMNLDSPDVSVLECQEHKEEIKYYCTPCAAALCTVCALAKHSKHETVDVATALETQRLQIQEYVSILKGYIVEYEAKGEHVAVIRKEKEEKLKVTREDITKHVQTCVKALQNHEARLLSELDNTHQMSLSKLKDEEKSIQATVNAIQGLCETSDELVHSDQSLQLLATSSSIQVRLKKMADTPCAPVSEELCRTPTFKPMTEINIGKLFISGGGDVLAGATSIDTNLDKPSPQITGSKMSGIKLTINSPAPPPSSASSSAGRSLSRTQSMPASPALSAQNTRRHRPSSAREAGAESVYCREGIKLLWKTADNNEGRDVAFLPEGSIVTTQYKLGSDKLQVYDSTGELKRAVSSSCSSQIIKPWGVAVNVQAATIAITDHGDSSVKFLDNELHVTQTWRRLFEKPSGIAVMRTGEYVITDVGERYLHKVSVYLPNGIRIRDFGSKGKEHGQLLLPNYVTVDHQDRIIISDSGLNCVKVMDRMGKQLAQFGPINEQGEPFCPQGVAVDTHNNIILVDQTYGGVSMFSPEGRFIQNLVQTGSLPWGLGVHDTGLMAVTTDPSVEMIQVPLFKAP